MSSCVGVGVSDEELRLVGRFNDQAGQGADVTTIPNRSQSYTLIAVIGLLLYGAYLIRSASYSVNGVDGSGYANIARSFLQGSPVKPVKELDQFGLPESFIPLFTPVAYIPILSSKTIVPMYPIGVPLHMVAAVLIFGWNYGPFLVNPILAVLCLILIYLLGRDLGLERGYSIAGALILIANPTFNFMAVQPVSDIAAMFWALVTIWAARRSDRGVIWGLVTGAAFGISFLVRPVNVLLLPTLILVTGFRLKTLITIIWGGLPFAILYFTYNTIVFGSPLLTGYTLATAQNLVTLSGFTERFEFYFYWLTLTMSPLVLIGWISMGFLSSIEGRRRALLILWFGTFLLFFACYNIYDEWWCTRFLLPAYPALIIGALLAAQHLMDEFIRRKYTLAQSNGSGVTRCVARLRPSLFA